MEEKEGYTEGRHDGQGRFRRRQKTEGGEKGKCEENVARLENEVKLLNQGLQRKGCSRPINSPSGLFIDSETPRPPAVISDIR